MQTTNRVLTLNRHTGYDGEFICNLFEPHDVSDVWGFNEGQEFWLSFYLDNMNVQGFRRVIFLSIIEPPEDTGDDDGDEIDDDDENEDDVFGQRTTIHIKNMAGERSTITLDDFDTLAHRLPSEKEPELEAFVMNEPKSTYIGP